MSDEAIDDLTAVLPALLDSLDALAHFARHFDPSRFDETLAVVSATDERLRAARGALRVWPEHLAGLRSRIVTASDAALEAFAGLRAAPTRSGRDPRGYARSARNAARARCALSARARLAASQPLLSGAGVPWRRGSRNTARKGLACRGLRRLAYWRQARRARRIFDLCAGILHVRRTWPIVFALHGGGGDGFSFLWSWLPTARALGAILVAPTAIGRTWALAGDDVDTPNLCAFSPSCAKS